VKRSAERESGDQIASLMLQQKRKMAVEQSKALKKEKALGLQLRQAIQKMNLKSSAQQAAALQATHQLLIKLANE